MNPATAPNTDQLIAGGFARVGVWKRDDATGSIRFEGAESVPRKPGVYAYAVGGVVHSTRPSPSAPRSGACSRGPICGSTSLQNCWEAPPRRLPSKRSTQPAGPGPHRTRQQPGNPRAQGMTSHATLSPGSCARRCAATTSPRRSNRPSAQAATALRWPIPFGRDADANGHPESTEPGHLI
jgi:hypothetical protein